MKTFRLLAIVVVEPAEFSADNFPGTILDSKLSDSGELLLRCHLELEANRRNDLQEAAEALLAGSKAKSVQILGRTEI